MARKNRDSGNHSKRRDIIKASTALSVFGGTGVVSASSDVDSTTPPKDLTVNEVEPHSGGNQVSISSGSSMSRSALIIKDCNAWNAPANESVLQDYGIPYDVITSAGLEDTERGSYTDIILVSTQPAYYYERLSDQQEKIRNYVSNGGVLHAHVATNGWPCTTTGTPAFLPKDVDTAVDLRDNLTKTKPSHPLLNKVGSLDSWNSSTHGYLTNVPKSAKVYVGVSGAPESKPTFIEYTHGDGTVLATTQTIEWPFAQYRGSENLLRNELSYVPENRGSGIDLSGLISEKRDTISQIRNLAGITLSDNIQRVDQEAEDLVDLIDGSQDNVGLKTKQEQREMLERIIAAEDVTRISTSTVVGDESPTQTMIENIFSLTKGLAVELASRATGGLARRFANSLAKSLFRKFEDLLAGLMGRGTFPPRRIIAAYKELDEIQKRHFFSYNKFANENEKAWKEVGQAASENGISVLDGGLVSPLISELDESFSLMDGIEEIIFEAYYFDSSAEFPEVSIPTPETLELQDLQVYYDVPEETLPKRAQPLVPDEIELRIETDALEAQLPDPEPLEQVQELLETLNETAETGGIGDTIDERIEQVKTQVEDSRDLTEQDDDKRDDIREKSVAAIEFVSQFAKDLIANLEKAQEVFKGAQQLTGIIMFGAILAASVSFATGIGFVGFLSLATLMAQVAAVISATVLIIDSVQVLTGFTYMSGLTVFHGGTTRAIIDDEFGGVA